MISQIEYHVKQQEFDQALSLVPRLHHVFAENAELTHVIKQLQQDLVAHRSESLDTLQYIKDVIIG